MIGQTVSHYKILEKLGEGGMGVVYKAEDTKLMRTVALKFLSSQSLGTPEEKIRFVHEAQTAAALDHPNICTVHEINESDGHTFITMTYVDGKSLRQKIESGPLKLDDALGLAVEIANGLQDAHEKGIVHRDIKSANIMVTRKGQAKITDFGLAKLPGSTQLTKTGTTVGTVAYMSPEQARGEAVDHRSDIWSFGVVLYEMLAGHLPFRGDHEQAVTYQIVHEKAAPITTVRSGIPLELERIVSKCMEKDPSNRYQHVDEILVDFRRTKSTPKVKSRKVQLNYVLPISAVLIGIILLLVFQPFKSNVNSDGASQMVRVAVLPFDNLGAPEDEYFTDGITDEIISKLALIRGIGVISRTSSMQYKNTDKGLRRIGQELGVAYILEGTARWDKRADREKVRITPQLIDVSSDLQVWAANYDHQIEEIFDVQADIAAKVASALDIALLEPERRSLHNKPTENLEAYQAYVQGLQILRGVMNSSDNIQQTQKMFDRAVELDPTFALAYARLSEAHSAYYHWGYDRTETRLAYAKTAADRALELEPELAEGHLALGLYYYRGFRDYERALEECSIAEGGLPNNPDIHQLVAAIKRRQGDFEASKENFKRAFELNPLHGGLAAEVGFTYHVTRRWGEAERYYDLALAVDPDRAAIQLWKAENYWALGDLAKARATLEKAPVTNDATESLMWFRQRLYERNYQAILDIASNAPLDMLHTQENVRPVRMLSAIAYELMGETELAYASFDSARVILEREAKARPEDHRMRGALGLVYAGLERKEDAIREGKQGMELFPCIWGRQFISILVG